MANLSLAFEILAKDKASKEFNQVGDAADRAGKKGGKFGAAMKAGAAAGGVALVALGKSSVTAFVEAEQSSVRLDEALKKFPATADKSRASFDALNASLARKTKFDDDATASGQAVLAQFGLTGTQIQQLTPLLQDYAAKTGKDLPTAAQDLGKAVMGQGRALKAVGLDLKDTGSATGNLEGLMAGLRTQVGGFATAEGTTAAGRAEILRNQFGELQEAIGARLVPALVALAGGLLTVIDFIDRNSAVIVPLVAVLGTFAAVIYTITTATKIYTAVQAALNVVMALNPFVLVAAAVVALGVALVVAYKKSETFRNIVNGLFDVLKRLVGFTPLGALIKNFDAVRDAIAGAVREAKNLISKLKDIPGVGLLGAAGGALGDVFRASGGPVSGGKPYVVGERGPEWFVPKQSGQIISNAQSSRLAGNSQQITVNVRQAENEPAATAVPRALRNLGYTMGWA